MDLITLLQQDKLNNSLFPVGTYESTYHILKENETVKKIRKEINKGNITKKNIEKCVNTIINVFYFKLKRYHNCNIMFCILAVALKDTNLDIKEKYLKDLEKTKDGRVSISQNIARLCLKDLNTKPKKIGTFVFHPPDENGEVYVENNYYLGEQDTFYFSKEEAQELLNMWN